MLTGDTSWFPVGRAIQLEGKSMEKDGDIATLLKTFGDRLAKIERGVLQQAPRDANPNAKRRK
jgi:hypothetical protein